MKRHKMAGDTMTHGTHEFFRHGGSIGCRLTPGRVHKGKRMSGHMGDRNYTASDLVVVKVLEDNNVVIVKGAVPGAANGLVLLKGSTKNVKKYIVPQPQKEVEAKNPMKAAKKGQTTAKK
jgi:large subunit ribosomal protein L3